MLPMIGLPVSVFVTPQFEIASDNVGEKLFDNFRYAIFILWQIKKGAGTGEYPHLSCFALAAARLLRHQNAVNDVDDAV